MNIRSLMVAACIAGWLQVAQAAEDLRAYYETQKKEAAEDFAPPRLGSQVAIRLAAGQVREGILMKLDSESLSLMTDNGTVDYRRSMLHDSTRQSFFAEDYASAIALERTREYKNQIYAENLAEYHAGIHSGSLSVTSKSDKDSEKEVEEEEREGKDGSTIATTTTTRTYTEVQNLKVTVANLATHPDSYTLAWAFIGKSVVTGALSVHDSGNMQVAVDGRNRKTLQIASKGFIVEKETRSIQTTSSGSRDPSETVSGTDNAGWVVVLKHGSEVLDVEASSSSYQTDEWINRL